MPEFSIQTAIGVGGTVTALSSVILGLEHFNPDKIHKYMLTLKRIKFSKNLFIKKKIKERKKIIGLDPNRAEVILAGNIICYRIMIKYGIDKLLVSNKGLGWGLLYDEMHE